MNNQGHSGWLDKLAGILHPVPLRALILLVAYSLVLAASRWAAYQLRFDFNVPEGSWSVFREHLWWVPALQLLSLGFFGQYSGILGYFSLPDLRRLLYAAFASTSVLLGIRYQFPDFYAEPRGVILVDALLALAGVGVIRLGCRFVREGFLAVHARPIGP